MGAAAWLTLVAIIIALSIGVASLLQTRNIQKGERKQRLLNEIVNWATDLINCTAGFTFPAYHPAATKKISLIMARSDTYFKHRAVNARSKYIQHIASEFGEDPLSAVKTVTSKLSEFISILEADLAVLQNGGSENRETVSKCELELYDLSRDLIENIAEIKVKESKVVWSMRKTDIAFGVAILAIGYNFLPDKGPEWLNWATAVALLIIGAGIIFRAITTR